MSSKQQSENSFYRLGGIEILTFMQDEESKLWKFYLSTPEHYVVSREFDKSHGLYANAPEDVIRQGLMDFSASLEGEKMTLFDVIDRFIDRCFDDDVFPDYVENAVWTSISYPTYEEVEEIMSTYSCRILWARDGNDPKNPNLGELMGRLLFRTPTDGTARGNLIDEIVSEFKSSSVANMFMNKEQPIEDILSDSRFDGMPIFIGEFSKDNNEFLSFKYSGH